MVIKLEISSLSINTIPWFIFWTNVSNHGTVSAGAIHMEDVVSRDESTPIIVVIPGLTSDSSSAISYIMIHFTCMLNVVIFPCPHCTTLLEFGRTTYLSPSL